MKPFRTSTCVVFLCTIAGARASAETIWQWTHVAHGEGWANVFDGGPVKYHSGATQRPDDADMWFSASDFTRAGVLGADYDTAGGSSVGGVPADHLIVRADFSTSYTADFRVDADRPGGEGHGWISSVVEFVMPVDELIWGIVVRVQQGSGFSGLTTITVENVTQQITILELVNRGIFAETTLLGQAGDLIRVSFDSSGEGSFPAGLPSVNGYRARMDNTFIVPEPSALGLLGVAVICVRTVRRRTGTREVMPGR